MTICCTATLLEFLSKSRFQCLVMAQTRKETGITTGRRIAMLEHLGRLVSTAQSLKHRSSTTLPRKARLDCICDITVGSSWFHAWFQIAEYFWVPLWIFWRDYLLSDTCVCTFHHPLNHWSLRMFLTWFTCGQDN